MLFDSMGVVGDRLCYTSDKQAHLLKRLEAQNQEICQFTARFFPLILVSLDLVHLGREEGEMRQKPQASDSGCGQDKTFICPA